MKQIFTAHTVDEAKQLASEEFSASIEKISFTILEEPKKGLFGKIKGEAKVEAEYTPSKADVAVKYITDVLTAMDVTNITCEVTENEEGCGIEVRGDGLEELIGKKGELLDSLQYLSSLVCNKVDRDYYRITIDSNGFREKRKAHLEELAEKIANNVKKTGRSAALEPMNPYERRIVHSKVSEIEGVTSKSVGVDPHRKVIVSPTEKKRYNNDRHRNRHPKQQVHHDPLDMTTSFEKEYKRPKPEDNINAGLYGKIDL
ncbi:MAG: RNA-binding cell elongation regulator Jag/EloR [Oscillospiraceae bacterium]